MGAKLTQYDDELRKRIEVIRKRENLKQPMMASMMGVPLERYKRFIYGQAKIPAEAIATLIENLPVDPDYVLYGKEGGIMRLIEVLLGSSDKDKAEFFFELSRVYRRRGTDKTHDYITDDGLFVETHGDTKKKKKG